MPNLGVPELVIIFLIVILLFGSTRLPSIGRGIGEGIRNFKKGMKGGEDDPRTPEHLEEKPR